MSNKWKYAVTLLIILNLFTLILLIRKADVKMEGIRFTTPEVNIDGETIKNDLIKHASLLKIEGVNGGKIAFNSPDKINILNEKWVMAYFDDGHIDGVAIFEYKVESNGEISWRVIDEYLY